LHRKKDSAFDIQGGGPICSASDLLRPRLPSDKRPHVHKEETVIRTEEKVIFKVYIKEHYSVSFLRYCSYKMNLMKYINYSNIEESQNNINGNEFTLL